MKEQPLTPDNLGGQKRGRTSNTTSGSASQQFRMQDRWGYLTTTVWDVVGRRQATIDAKKSDTHLSPHPNAGRTQTHHDFKARQPAEWRPPRIVRSADAGNGS
jgi:hypothetical protein